MRILLVEDDLQTASYVATGFADAGHSVETAADGRRGLFLAAEGVFDLLVVDRMLPELDGLGLVKAARAAGISTPVLMLTALGAVDDRVAGLEGGADDYLVKPFSLAELLARSSALVRRAPLRDEISSMTVGDLRLDRRRRTVHRGSVPIELQPRELHVLELLMANAGQVVTRTMLLETVWGFNFDPATNIVESHISRIRSKINRGGDPALIHTVRGAGYMIRAT